MYVRDDQMAVKRSSIRLDTDLAGEAAKILGARSRSEAVDVALREIVALKRIKKLTKKQAGKLSFDGYTEYLPSPMRALIGITSPASRPAQHKSAYGGKTRRYAYDPCPTST